MRYLPSLSFAEQFLCIAEKASGLIHEESGWSAERFSGSNKYLVNFDKRTVNLFGESDPVHSNCLNYREAGKQLFLCDENFRSFMMSSDTMKYLLSMPYIDYVLDMTSGASHIEIGTCTKF